ncbi:hypothetical protein K469DRAFT_702192 [Zopfia rhizophila CBS 207.26]|uniref:Chromo domain-containing protein n=1 Tax=Zopfia rhizophila CBS 207.26 TaxID=1314779 RepID=A0A6A6D7I4_9PEZI|nr:hypothetical protein K469DRAFT_702192 [Zopfia rhizophila CBS 207.26]
MFQNWNQHHKTLKYRQDSNSTKTQLSMKSNEFWTEDDTWEPVRNLKNSLELIDQYHRAEQRTLAPRLYPMNKENARRSTQNLRRKAKRHQTLQVAVCQINSDGFALPPSSHKLRQSRQARAGTSPSPENLFWPVGDEDEAHETLRQEIPLQQHRVTIEVSLYPD